MVTLAFAQMFFYIFHDTPLGGGSTASTSTSKPDGRDLRLPAVRPRPCPPTFYFIPDAGAGVRLPRPALLQSPFGRVLVGIKSNEHRMQSLGYFTFRYKLAAFAGRRAWQAGGFLYAVLFGFVTPELLSWHQSGNVLLMVILGGMGNLVARWPAPSPSRPCRSVPMWTKHWQLLMGP